MKSRTAIIFIILASAIFSSLFISSGMEAHSSGVCVPTMLQGAVCPTSSVLNSLNFHLNGLRLFFSGNIAAVLFLALVVFAALIFLDKISGNAPRPLAVRMRLFNSEKNFIALKKINHWSVLRKNFDEVD